MKIKNIYLIMLSLFFMKATHAVSFSKSSLATLFDGSPIAHSSTISTNGLGAVSWIELDSSWTGTGHPVVAASYSSLSETFDAPVLVSYNDTVPSTTGAFETVEATIDMNSTGSAAIAWYNQNTQTIYTAFRDSDTGWQTPVEAVTGLSVDQLSLVATCSDVLENGVTIVYCDQPRYSPNEFSTLSYIQSTTGSGLTWSTPAAITTGTGTDWNLSHSDNKNFVVSWQSESGTQLNARAMIDGTLTDTYTVHTTTSATFDEYNSHAIAINNSGNMVAAWLIEENGNVYLQASLYTRTLDSWEAPTTLASASLQSAITTHGVSVSFNNLNRALVFSNLSTQQGSSAENHLFFAAEYTPTNRWQIVPNTQRVALNGLQLSVFNNDNNNGIALFSKHPGSSSSTLSNSFRYFSTQIKEFGPVNQLFENEFIASTWGAASLRPPYAVAYNHMASQILLITPNLNTFAASGSFQTSQPQSISANYNVLQTPFQAEAFSLINWQAPVDTYSVRNYEIWQNGVKVRTVDATQLTEEIHNLDTDTTSFTFQVQALDSIGIAGFPIKTSISRPANVPF